MSKEVKINVRNANIYIPVDIVDLDKEALKNFHFANTAKGATASSNIYSIVETAKANNLVVERYLIYLFDSLLKLDVKDSESLENLMPWTNKIPENMKIKEKK